MYSKIPFYNTSSSSPEITVANGQVITTAVILSEELSIVHKELLDKMLSAIDISMESEVIIVIPSENENISAADLSDKGIELVLVFDVALKEKIEVSIAKETGFHYKLGSISIIFAPTLKELSVSNIDKKILWNALKGFKQLR
jgi:hypothetical protein